MKNIIFTFILLTTVFTQSVQAESLRVNTVWLKSNLNKESLVILDTRSKDIYEIGHIQGAISFPDVLSYQQKSTGGRIVEPDVIQELLRERGIDINSFVVVYDEGGLLDAARVFWTLEVYGLKNVRILEGGFADWEKKSFPTTQDIPSITPSSYIAKVDHRRIASKFTTQLATINPNQFVLDARANNAYKGEVSTAKRFGHIPSAINISVHENFTEKSGTDRYLLNLSELKKVYSSIPQDNKVISYCAVGKISSTNYLALRELGYDVANYDASWGEWGNDFSLPIEK